MEILKDFKESLGILRVSEGFFGKIWEIFEYTLNVF